MTVTGIKKEKAHWTAGKIEMKNVQTGHRTTLEVASRNAEKAPEDSLFTPQFLERQ